MKTHNMASDTLYYSLTTADLERSLVIQSKYIASCITISYIMFSMVIGPNIMKNRKPMDLQLTMLLYNLVLVVFNAYLSYQTITLAVEMWPYRCNFQDSPIYTESRKFYKLGYHILIVKFLELFETVIFVLRKKFQQVSFLHVSHHASIFFFYWICLKFRLIGYYVILTGAVNLSVHVALYLYYALAALGPGVRKYLWWKQYLSIIEFVQFFVMIAFMAYSYMTGCGKYSNLEKVIFALAVIVGVLFVNFYIRTYMTKKSF